MTRKVVSPIALDKSINTTEQTPRNIADVLAQQLEGIKTAIESGNGNLEAAFVCYYGVTTATQIKEAIEDGKVPYFYYNGSVAQLWKVETDKYTFRTTNTRSVEGQTILDVVDYIVNGSVWSTITREVSGGSSSGQSYIASVNSLADFDTTGKSGMQDLISVSNVPADGVYQVSVMLHITPKTASATKSDLVLQFTSSDNTGWPSHTFHAVVDDSQTFAQQLSFSTSVSLKAGENTLRIQCGGLNTEYLVFVDELTVAQLVNGVYHNGDDFADVHTLAEAADFNNDDGVLVDGATGGPRFMLWQTLANKVLGFIKSLSTTITSFRTGDYIAVDGTNGTAKMGKEDLLKETAENVTSKLVQDALDDDDFDISDENGNVLVRFRRGNIVVKNFDSSKTPSTSDNPIYDFVISDELKNILFIINKGHIKTKNFDSEKQIIVNDVVYPDFSITDKQGNILLEIVGGHIKTKNFDSSIYGNVGIDRYEEPATNPLDKLISSASMVRIFDSIGVVGASFDSGEIEYMDGGVKHYLDRYDNAWGTRLAKMNGNECEIFAYGGQTAINWVKNSAEYNAPDGLPHTERTWAGLKAATPKKAYVIQLGGNDANNLWRYSAGVGDCSTDIGVYDPVTDTDTNAQSYAGYMAGIIQRIKSVQPRAKIFVCTMQRWTRADSFGVALDDVVRDLPNYFTDVFLVDFRTYQPPKSAELSEMYLAGGHPNEAGHVWLTDNYNTYIDWIIRTNFSLFNDVQLIGTNYTLPT